MFPRAPVCVAAKQDNASATISPLATSCAEDTRMSFEG
jgi:hypothetical protein